MEMQQERQQEHLNPLSIPFSLFLRSPVNQEQTAVRGQAGGGATGVGPPTLKSGWSSRIAVQKVRVREET